MTSLRRIILLGCLALGLPTTVLAQLAYTTTTVNMRAGPDPTYPLVLRVYPGTQVNVFGCLDNWSWCDVGVGLDRGWVFAQYLAYPYQGQRVPIYGYGPTIGLPIVTFTIGPYWDNYYRNRPWWSQRSYWYQRPPPPHYRPPPPPSYRPPPYYPPTHGGRPPPPRPPPGGGPPPQHPPPGGSRPPPPPGGGRPPPPSGGRPPPPQTKPMPMPKPGAPPTSAPPGPTPR